MTFRRFGHADLVATFEALDRVATTPRRVVVFGGTAIALYTSSSAGTSDVDHEPPGLEDLVAKLTARGFDLPTFSMPGVIAEFPYHYDSRLQRALPHLTRIELWLPEPHDLVLSKILRWYANDEAHIRDLHTVVALSMDTLIDRFRNEMDHVMGDRSRIERNFIECIDMLFGEIAADEARDRIKKSI